MWIKLYPWTTVKLPSQDTAQNSAEVVLNEGWSLMTEGCIQRHFIARCLQDVVSHEHITSPPVLGFRSHKQPTPCPWHGHLTQPISC